MRSLRTAALTLALVVGITTAAHATSISYTVDVGAGALNGNPVTHVAIFEAGGGSTSLSFGFSLNATGLTTLTHDVAFVPTSSLIVGLDLPGAVGDGKTHVVFFTNPEFALNASGVLFSVVFPNTRHSDFIARLLAAEGGDATQQAWLLNFFATDGAPAAFAPGSPTLGVEFTGGTVLPPSPVPEPSTLMLFGLGALAGAFRLRRARS